MKSLIRLTLIFGFIFPLAMSAQTDKSAILQNKNDSLSYALGIDIAKNLSRSGVTINEEALANGLRDVLNGTGAKFTHTQAQSLVREFAMEAQRVQMRNQSERAQAAIQEGAAFLAENKHNEGVKETASGLQYKVLRNGDGVSPDINNTVKVHYEGRLLNGTIFDSSYQRGQPIEFPLSNVIQGWIEGLQLMQTGAKYQLFIPHNLGYGERGSPPSIGPNETLIFDVELLEVK